MNFLPTTIVVLMLALSAAFVLWGGWLCLEQRLGRAGTAHPPRAAAFERVGSLVLLALLCTTLAALS